MASVDAFKETYSREIVKDASRAMVVSSALFSPLSSLFSAWGEATSCINHDNKTTIGASVGHCCSSPTNLEPFLQILHSAADINPVRSVIADARVCVVMTRIYDHYSSPDLARALFNLLDLFMIESGARKFAKTSHVAARAFDARCGASSARLGPPNCGVCFLSFFLFFLLAGGTRGWRFFSLKFERYQSYYPS